MIKRSMIKKIFFGHVEEDNDQLNDQIQWFNNLIENINFIY